MAQSVTRGPATQTSLGSLASMRSCGPHLRHADSGAMFPRRPQVNANQCAAPDRDLQEKNLKCEGPSCSCELQNQDLLFFFIFCIKKITFHFTYLVILPPNYLPLLPLSIPPPLLRGVRPYLESQQQSPTKSGLPTWGGHKAPVPPYPIMGSRKLVHVPGIGPGATTRDPTPQQIKPHNWGFNCWIISSAFIAHNYKNQPIPPSLRFPFFSPSLLSFLPSFSPFFSFSFMCFPCKWKLAEILPRPTCNWRWHLSLCVSFVSGDIVVK